LVVIVSSQIDKENASLQYVVDGYQHGVRYSDGCPLCSPPYDEPLILRRQEGIFFLDGRSGALDQRGLQSEIEPQKLFDFATSVSIIPQWGAFSFIVVP